MAEAVITRTGSLGGSDAEVSNETKQLLGLNNNASLDDVIQTVAVKDPNYATIVVTVKDVDGSSIANSQVSMATNTTLTYTTNEIGKCTFKTNYGTATIMDKGPNPYIDLGLSNSVKVDSVVGGVYQVELKRKILGNGSNILISSNNNIIFSKYTNTVDIYLTGGGGGGGDGYLINAEGRLSWESGMTIYYNTLSGHSGGSGAPGNTNILKGFLVQNDINYNINIGVGGSGGKNHINVFSDTHGLDRKNRALVFGGTNLNMGYGTNGGSGGSSFFSNILSASGGLGGSAANYYSDGISPNNGYFSGSGGGYNIRKTTFSTSYNENNSSRPWVVTYGYNLYANGGNKGTSGMCWLNNIQYKV